MGNASSELRERLEAAHETGRLEITFAEWNRDLPAIAEVVGMKVTELWLGQPHRECTYTPDIPQTICPLDVTGLTSFGFNAGYHQVYGARYAKDGVKPEAIPDALNSFLETFPLQQLESLSIVNTNITAVPAAICQSLPALTHLDLSNNQLNEVPADLAALSNLKWLSLASNSLIALPEAVARLPALAQLDLSGNVRMHVSPVLADRAAVLAYAEATFGPDKNPPPAAHGGAAPPPYTTRDGAGAAPGTVITMAGLQHQVDALQSDVSSLRTENQVLRESLAALSRQLVEMRIEMRERTTFTISRLWQ